MATKSTDGKCVHCGGKIVEKIVKEFNAMDGPLIIGLGSAQQFHDVSQGYHCTLCGIKYEFVPKPKDAPTSA